MFDKFHEECGVFAIYGHQEAANMANLGIFALQHRGQESAGIASADGAEVYCHKAMGHVADIFTVEVLNGLPGDKAIGHTRYSTTGDSAKLNAQPFSAMTNKGRLALAHNGNITNAMEIRNALESDGAIFSATSDTEVVLHLISRSRERSLPAALRDALLQLEGAFSLVLLTKNELIVVRDPHGFRPMAMGQMEMSGDRISYVFASETCAFDLMGAVYMGDVEPGEMVIVNKDGLTRERYAPRRPLAQCVFEHVYFSRPDSMVFGRPVVQSREAMGRLLARQNPISADVVVPVPDSGVAAAIGFASESGIPFRMGLIRNHHVGRTFIEPSQAIRDFGVKLKLNPVRHLLRGKRVVLVDDSIVRGTTSRKIVRMVRNAGATEVHLRISCPPTISPCFYGVDTPTKNELIAANHSVEEICRYVEADSLEYLSLSNLRDAVVDTRSEYCYACYTGDYPTDLVSVESLIGAKTQRG
ncbi:MAG: amidophosphoribosyltransferase [Bryobacterales bacterium]|nr:amidophosphoribosyltransferase [Bryobacterales bacterium]